MPENMEIDRPFYNVLSGASKAMIERLGGEVRISYKEMKESWTKKTEIRFIGDKENPEAEGNYWLFAIVEGEAPADPVRVEETEEES